MSETDETLIDDIPQGDIENYSKKDTKEEKETENNNPSDDEEFSEEEFLEEISKPQETDNAPGVQRIVFEKSDRERTSIEEEFTHFIKEVYEPRKQQYLDEVEEIYGGFEDFKNLKATRGNYKKLKEISEKLLEARESLFSDIFDMMKNPRFKFPRVEREGEKYWYTTRMNNLFGFKMLKTSFYAKADQVREDLAQTEPIENEYEPRALGDKINNETKREEVDVLSDEHHDMREYFKTLSECLPNGGITETESKLQGLLEGYAEEHPEDGDAREEVKQEIAELTEVIKECIESVGGAPDDENSTRIKSLDEGDPGISSILSFVKDEAKWPMPTDYEYKGYTYQKYTFLNIDELMKDQESKEENEEEEEYLTDEEVDIDLDSLIVPDPNSVEVDLSSAKEDFNSHVVKQNKLKVSTVPIDTMKYWRRYLGIATIVGLPFLATGLIITSPEPYVKLPCIYIPLKVFSISKAGLVIVIALAIRGVSINIMLIVLNMNQQHNSLMLPITILLSDIRDTAFSQIKKLTNMVPMIANGIMGPFKSNNIALLKENKKYNAEMAGLKALKIPGKNELIRDIKEELGQDTRMMVNRLESDTNTIKDQASNAANELAAKTAEAYTDFASGFANLMKEKKGSEQA